MLSVCTGMRVELTEKLGAILKATAGTVKHVLLHPNEDMQWCAKGSAQRRDGEVVLRYLPSLLVYLDGYADGSIPGHPDLALLEPTSSHRITWRWQTQRTLRSSVERYQLERVDEGVVVHQTSRSSIITWRWQTQRTLRSSVERYQHERVDEGVVERCRVCACSVVEKRAAPPPPSRRKEKRKMHV